MDMEKVYHGRIRKISSFNAVALAFILPILLAACSAGTGYSANPEQINPPGNNTPGAPSPTQDITPPVINITAPTTGASYTTTSVSVTVTGAATDNLGLSQLSWSNNLGGSGSIQVSGTSATGSFNVALSSGDNTITVTARDTAGNTAQKQLTVRYTPTTSNAATLTWDAVTATNLMGYRLYYGTAPGTYLQPLGQGLSVGNVTTYILMGLSNGTRYYFAVTAIDTLGNESGYSNEAFKDIP